MISSISIVFALSLLAFTSASPVIAHQDGQCMPSSGGFGVQFAAVTTGKDMRPAELERSGIVADIITSVAQWELSLVVVGGTVFNILQTPSTLKALAVLDATLDRNNGGLGLQDRGPSQSQQFSISCDTCIPPVNNGDTFANNCIIQPIAQAVSSCLTLVENLSEPNSAFVSSLPCNNDPSQRWNIIGRH